MKSGRKSGREFQIVGAATEKVRRPSPLSRKRNGGLFANFGFHDNVPERSKNKTRSQTPIKYLPFGGKIVKIGPVNREIIILQKSFLNNIKKDN